MRSLRALPLWGRWVLTIAAYALVIGGVVLVIRIAGAGNSTGPQAEARAEAQADREAQIVIEEDQQPHTARWPVTAPPAPALQRAVAADLEHRIDTGQLTGPLERVRCGASRAAHADRAPYRCTATVNGIPYLLLAVAESGTSTLVWCKVDPPPTTGGSAAVPVSPRCAP